jgi:hypothetical protein
MLEKRLGYVGAYLIWMALLPGSSYADALYTVTSLTASGPGPAQVYGFNNAGQLIGYNSVPQGLSGGYGFVYDGSPRGQRDSRPHRCFGDADGNPWPSISAGCHQR